jgi:predicted  nucleic acid-binding Zn-ribbon protein
MSEDYPEGDLAEETTTDETQDEIEKTDGEETGVKKALKDTQASYTRSRQELADTRREIEELRRQLATVQATSEKREPTPDWIDELKPEDLAADPENQKQALKRLRDEMAGVLQYVVQQTDAKLKSQHPEMIALAEQIAELKKDRDYAGFSDDQLMVIAKKTKVEKPKEDEDTLDADGSPMLTHRGGSVRRSVDIKKSALFRKIYGDQFNK